MLDVQNFIAENRRKSKLNVTNTIEQNVVNIQTTSTNSNSEGLPTNASIEEPNSQVTELQAPWDTGMSNTSEPLPNSQGQVNKNVVKQSQLNAPPSNGKPGVRSIAALNHQNLFYQGSKGKSQITVHFGIVLTMRCTKTQDCQIQLLELVIGRSCA